jgi:hypothetical protein
MTRVEDGNEERSVYARGDEGEREGAREREDEERTRASEGYKASETKTQKRRDC